MAPIIGKAVDGQNVAIDLPRLLETRLLIQANSGGGKSWALRRLLEQTANKVQQIVIDTEGEFSSLREKFDYIIAAPHDGDAVAHPSTAALLARRLLETGVSAIVDIYDLKAHERKAFVRIFLEAMVNAPKRLWHPVLVALDEAHVYAPEKGQAESAGAVADIATRGRKRGQCLIAATQRLAKLNKDVAAELLNKMIGRTGLDIDVKRAADDLGMMPREATTTLRDMEEGRFFMFGPAFCRAVTKVQVGGVITSHPKAGQRLMASPPAPSAKIRAVLAELSDLPKEAEQEARTLQELQVEVRRLKGALTRAQKRAEQSGVPETEVQRRERAAAAQAMKNTKTAPAITTESAAVLKAAQKAHDILGRALNAQFVTVSGSAPLSIPDMVGPGKSVIPKSQTEATHNEALTGPQSRILNALGWLESIGIAEGPVVTVAFLAGYRPGGGAFNNPRGQLRTAGLIEYTAGGMSLTDAGRAMADIAEPPQTNSELHERIYARLPGPERKLLAATIEVWPEPIADADLAIRTGYTLGGGAFNNPKGRLRTMGLITYPMKKHVRAVDILFPLSEAKP